jgi:hypothetical protein
MGRKRMGTAELTRVTGIASDARRARVRARPVMVAYAGMWVLTCLGVVMGIAAPGLAPRGQPHPTLHGTPSDFASIAIANARILSAPFLLALFRFPAGRRSRQLGDLLVVALLGGNALRVGLALGRDRGALLPYLPQLPVEWLAAALAAAAWLTLRTGARERTGLAYIAAVLVLIAAAAAVESIGTPHAVAREHTFQVEGSTGALRSPGPISVRTAGVVCLRRIVRRRRLSLQGRFAPFPSLSLGSARPPGRRCRTTSTTPGSRKGGTRNERSVCFLELAPSSALALALALLDRSASR